MTTADDGTVASGGAASCSSQRRVRMTVEMPAARATENDVKVRTRTVWLGTTASSVALTTARNPIDAWL